MNQYVCQPQDARSMDNTKLEMDDIDRLIFFSRLETNDCSLLAYSSLYTAWCKPVFLQMPT